MYLVYPLLQSKEFVVQDIVPLESLQDSQTPILPQKEKTEPSICFDQKCFTIQIANTPDTREIGLMNRKSLPENLGMLFVFDTPDIYGFWMKNTLMPLDIVWLDEDMVVVDTTTMIPCVTDTCPSYIPQKKALYALEINEGLIEKYAIQIGSIAIYSDK